MPYNAILADQLRPFLLPRKGVTEKSMFGGIAFLINGNMCVGVWKEFLILRMDVVDTPTLLKKPGIRPMDITGKPMRGWLMVEPKGYGNDEELFPLVEQAFGYAAGLPAKSGSGSK
ncbi:MAG: hypothetical protein Greene041619_617 [Candidatus Peregrinibacteria bacterium Greene0416_19]|nr:MAG: hypothetical protein Greene041619_617 [Candidatus Peregrinibacteria bacterium Greene0416_19]